ncbi:MAG TPA: mechanosensitive ion channel domain-containing protein [Casimicrobiaceae bacterium]|nr:mechanosensitive ion channel domain-containing protein [Casimicrobiaceae bacterium]
MIAPIDFSRLQVALALPRGWLELLLTLACIGIAWLVDRRLAQHRARRLPQAHLPGSFIDLGFPLIALLLVYVASIAWRHLVGPPFFLAIATPILIALAVIRMLAYALHRLFPAQTWLPASELAIGTAIWGLAILYFLGVLPEIRATLAQLVIPIGKTDVSLLTIFTGIAVVVVTLIVTLWISGLIEQRLALATQLDANLRVVLAKFIRAVLIVVAVLIALEQIGFDLTLLTVFGGALGVGIGLGLQKLASNYIAGFTILLDRSIRIGDLVTVDGRTGVVSNATSRYVVVRSGDGVEAIVPNETVVTTTVLNHSYTSPQVRLALQVQVAYDSDVEKALALLVEIALREPRVLRDAQAPKSFLVNFADNGITLELGVWINDPHVGQLDLKSSLNRAILKAFGANGIQIPFPQRDIRIVGAIPAQPDNAKIPESPP